MGRLAAAALYCVSEAVRGLAAVDAAAFPFPAGLTVTPRTPLRAVGWGGMGHSTLFLTAWHPFRACAAGHGRHVAGRLVPPVYLTAHISSSRRGQRRLACWPAMQLHHLACPSLQSTRPRQGCGAWSGCTPAIGRQAEVPRARQGVRLIMHQNVRQTPTLLRVASPELDGGPLGQRDVQVDVGCLEAQAVPARQGGQAGRSAGPVHARR